MAQGARLLSTRMSSEEKTQTEENLCFVVGGVSRPKKGHFYREQQVQTALEVDEGSFPHNPVAEHGGNFS